jgi:ABC-type antimicrobial peptide transport system permease subunit
VGGIGIMNIMLVSVTERTREIGVRKALGATQANILTQFLIEAVVLCLLGGVIGILFGAGTAVVLHKAFGWTTSVGLSSVLVAFIFAGVVGVGFGVWPARRAAALDPIESLRYE